VSDLEPLLAAGADRKRASLRLLLGLIGNALPFALISWGQIRVDSGLTGILMGVIPLFTLALAHFFVPGEQMTPRMVGGFAIGFVGLVVLLGPATLLEAGGESSEFPRQMAILFAAICYAINGVLSRRLGTLNALVSSATVMWTASAIALPIALWIDQPWSLTPSLAATTSAIWLGLFATALATIIFFKIVQSTGPTFLSLINYMIPVIALVAGMLFLGEALAGSVLIGLSLILAGLAFSQRAPRRR